MLFAKDRQCGTFHHHRASGRSEPGNGSAQCFLHLSEICVILVALSGPKEAFEAILAMAGHQVDMYVGDALTDVVVDSDKRSIGLQALFDSPFQQLRVLEQGPDQGSGKIGERLVMLPRH